MPGEFLDTLTMDFYRCAELPTEGGAAAAIRLIQQLGGQFLSIAGLRPEPDPFSTISEEGNSIGLMRFEHETLLLDSEMLNEIRRGRFPATVKGQAGFSFSQKTYSVHVSQAVWTAGQPFTDRLALGLLSFALYLYPHLRPNLGSIDELGWNGLEKDDVEGNRLPYVYWANIFGPEFVRLLGPDFFEHIPGWRVVDLPDGGVLYVATESFTEWWLHDQDDVVAHFRRRFPKIRQYRAVKGA
jgi:hypothetical protein